MGFLFGVEVVIFQNCKWQETFQSRCSQGNVRHLLNVNENE